jgi:hypothetical protein
MAVPNRATATGRAAGTPQLRDVASARHDHEPAAFVQDVTATELADELSTREEALVHAMA